MLVEAQMSGNLAEVENPFPQEATACSAHRCWLLRPLQGLVIPFHNTEAFFFEMSHVQGQKTQETGQQCVRPLPSSVPSLSPDSMGKGRTGVHPPLASSGHWGAWWLATTCLNDLKMDTKVTPKLLGSDTNICMDTSLVKSGYGFTCMYVGPYTHVCTSVFLDLYRIYTFKW